MGRISFTPFVPAHFSGSGINLPSLQVREGSECEKCQVLHMYYIPSLRFTTSSREIGWRFGYPARLADFATLAPSFMRSLTVRYAPDDHYGFTTKSACSIACYY